MIPRANPSKKRRRQQLELRRVLVEDEMGSKTSKSLDRLLISSDTTTSTTTKSAAMSTLDSKSNDSGCYSQVETATSTSSAAAAASVICLIESMTSRRSTDISGSVSGASDLLKRTIPQQHRNSVCDSIVLSSACSTTSSSSGSGSSTCEESNQRKAQLLCDQLNQILNISTTMHRSASTTTTNTTIQRKPSKLPIFRPLNRSHTFHHSVVQSQIENIDVGGEEVNEDDEDGLETNTIGSTNKQMLANYVLKNGKRLFTWNRKHQQTNNNHNETRFSVSTEKKSTSNELTNKLAAKLLAENIELTKQPYTDEVCF